jgi:hypothetical protein
MYLLDRSLGRPQSRSGRRAEEKVLDLTGTRNSDPWVVQPVASLYTECAIPARGPIQNEKRVKLLLFVTTTI